MHKLVILIGSTADPTPIEKYWPEFLHQVENMPGLIKESTATVENFLYGEIQYMKMHELYFDTSEELRQAMTSPYGKAAGVLLQRITGGNLCLFIADHKEDSLENIRKFSTSSHESNQA